MFFAPTEKDRRVVAVYFSSLGSVDRVAQYGLKDGKVFDFLSQTVRQHRCHAKTIRDVRLAAGIVRDVEQDPRLVGTDRIEQDRRAGTEKNVAIVVTREIPCCQAVAEDGGDATIGHANSCQATYARLRAVGGDTARALATAAFVIAVIEYDFETATAAFDRSFALSSSSALAPV